MAIVFHDGFEMGTTGAWSSVTGSPTVVGTQKKTGSYAMQCDTTGGAATAYATVDFGATANRPSVSFQFYISTAPNADCEIARCVASVAARKATVSLTSGRYLKSGATVGSTQLALSTLYRICIYFEADNKWNVFLDGNLEIDYNSASAVAGNTTVSIGIGTDDTSRTADLYFDDIVVEHDADGDLGDIRTLVSLPAGAGNYSEFTTIVPAGVHYTTYDDAPGSISDADYVLEASKGSTLRDTATIQSCATAGIGGSDTIKAVTVWGRMAGDNVDATAGITVRDNGTDYDYEEVLDDDVAYGWFGKIMVVMPNGGSAWSQARVNALEAGMIHGGDSDDSTLTALMVMIAFTPAAPGGWSHKFIGVANASIGKINGVAIASISKVNGVS